MRTIKLILEYDGTDYVGWQVQKNGKAVQEVVRQAVRTMTGEENDVVGASRTDAGVHALGQVAHFTTRTNIPGDGFLRGLNSMIPLDIRVLDARDASKDFHAQKDAKGKIYRYLINTAPVSSALHHRREWHVPHKLDLGAMREVGEVFIGKHDFKAFQASGSSVKHAVRTIKEVEISALSNGVAIEVMGDGFVRHMVRNMVGTMVEAGLGKRGPDDIKKLLEQGERTDAGICAPACGLYLVKVLY